LRLAILDRGVVIDARQVSVPGAAKYE
jgi:hypothetical protein